MASFIERFNSRTPPDIDYNQHWWVNAINHLSKLAITVILTYMVAIVIIKFIIIIKQIF